MKDLCLDVETTTYSKGSPFDRRNQLVCVAFVGPGVENTVLRPTGAGLAQVQAAVDACDRIVGFNLKFDLHWLRRAGVSFEGKRVYDVQAVEFVLTGQTHRFPSLNEVAYKYLKRSKIDEVAALWEAGVQTTDIPWNTLAKYAAEDVNLTLETAYEQIKVTRPEQRNLISIVNQDLIVLEEMEWNGIKFDRELSMNKGQQLEEKIKELQDKHNVMHSIPNFNWGSPDHLSALLYGGTILEVVKVPVGHFKTGKRATQVKYGNETREHKLPRLFKPPKGSALKKPGLYSVDEDTLASLDGGHEDLLKDLLLIKKMQKELSTYLYGLPKKQDEGGYTDYIYGQFNQCVAATGRLSSSNPNLQNLSEEAGRCLVSRYE